MAYLIVTIAVLALIFWLFSGREIAGEWVSKLFPKAPLQKGDQAHIYLNGKYNRKATITGVSADRLQIYNHVSLPVDYRGRFYACGVDANDGSKLIYVANRKHYRFIRAAELLRKMFNTLDDLENLTPEDNQDNSEATEENDEEADNEV